MIDPDVRGAVLHDNIRIRDYVPNNKISNNHVSYGVDTNAGADELAH